MIAMFQRPLHAVPDLRAGRLRLVAITPEMLEAEQRESAAELSRLTGATTSILPTTPRNRWLRKRR